MKKDFVDKYVNEMIRKEIVLSKTIFRKNKLFIERERIKRTWMVGGLLDELTLDDSKI
jgi:hypothetical protein